MLHLSVMDRNRDGTLAWLVKNMMRAGDSGEPETVGFKQSLNLRKADVTRHEISEPATSAIEQYIIRYTKINLLLLLHTQTRT
jgi:hypothetical protein